MPSHKIFVTPMVLSLLVACGGGGGGGTNTATSSTSADGTAQTSDTTTTGTSSNDTITNTYTGKRELAEINNNNYQGFLAIAWNAITDLEHKEDNIYKNLINGTPSVNGTYACVGGGTMTINNDKETGILHITYNDCRLTTPTINGYISIKGTYRQDGGDYLNPRYVSTKEITADLKETNTDGTIIISNFTWQFFDNGGMVIVVSDGNSKIYNQGKTIEFLANKLRLAKVIQSNGTSGSLNRVSYKTMDGQLCEGSNGCVNITTPIPFKLDTYIGAVFLEGKTILTGSTNARACEIATGGGGANQKLLDQNGNGACQ